MSDGLTQDEITNLLNTIENDTTESVEADVNSALTEALNIVYKDRANSYGNPEDNFKTISNFWSTYLTNKFNTETPIDTTDVAMMMILLKIARESNRHKRDNLVDIAGYIECADRIYNRG